MKATVGVSVLERVEAILRNPAIYELATLIPKADRSRGGRRRQYPVFMWIVYETLLSVYESARQVEAELAHPLVWNLVRRLVRERFPTDPSQWLPETPMRRHHYLYARSTYLTRPDILTALNNRHRDLAATQARDLGLLDPDGPGSWTHPDLTRMLHADGKVVTPLYKAQPGDTRVDKQTGEILIKRFEPDGALHFQGDGETAWGTKFVHGRIILDVAWVPNCGGEAKTAMGCFTLPHSCPARRA